MPCVNHGTQADVSMTIRQRIAYITAGVMVLLLLALSVGVYVAMSRNLHDAVDTRLRTVYTTYSQNPASLTPLPDGNFIVNLPALDPFTSPGLFMQVVNREGLVASQSASLAGNSLPVPDEILEENLTGQRRFYTTTIDDTEIRVLSVPVFIQGEPEALAAVQVAESLVSVNETLSRLRNILILGSLAATIVITAVAWFLAGAAMRPLARMSATAQAIGGAGDLSQRLDPPGTGDEVDQLVETFNAMLDRLEASFQTQRRFVADASHELRTPLTALRGNTEIMRRMVSAGDPEMPALIEGLDDVGNEVDRMTRLVQDLLTLARADVGWQPEMAVVDLAAIARNAGNTIAPLTANHVFRATIPEDLSVPVQGHADQLKQLVLILLDNAIQHTPAESVITLGLEVVDNEAVLTVSDTGPGIAPEHHARIFERFYRTDSARSRSEGGTGLGLSIAHLIATTHTGTITLHSAVGEGATFEVRIPRAANM